MVIGQKGFHVDHVSQPLDLGRSNSSNHPCLGSVTWLTLPCLFPFLFFLLFSFLICSRPPDVNHPPSRRLDPIFLRSTTSSGSRRRRLQARRWRLPDGGELQVRAPDGGGWLPTAAEAAAGFRRRRLQARAPDGGGGSRRQLRLASDGSGSRRGCWRAPDGGGSRRRRRLPSPDGGGLQARDVPWS